jgi:hypothetical protein
VALGVALEVLCLGQQGWDQMYSVVVQAILMFRVAAAAHLLLAQPEYRM